MKLTHVHPGDIVRVDDGLPYHAVVLERERGRLRVRMLGRTQAPAHRQGRVGRGPLAPQPPRSPGRPALAVLLAELVNAGDGRSAAAG
jgi:hypothetical protein